MLKFSLLSLLMFPRTSTILRCNSQFIHSRLTSFWFDLWHGHTCLKDSYRRLFILAKDPFISVDKSLASLANLAWCRRLTSRERGLFSSLLRDLSGVVLSDSDDSLLWNEKQVPYSTRSFRDLWFKSFLRQHDVLLEPFRLTWHSLASPRIRFFSWLALRDRIPCSSFLHNRGIRLFYGSACLSCMEYEDSAHVILSCPAAWNIWCWFFRKIGYVWSKIISKGKPVIEEAVLGILRENIPESNGIADLGCSSGPNSLLVVSEIMDIIHARCRNLGRSSPEFRVSLNDLPGNDFNSIFESLPAFFKKKKQEKGTGFGRCCISGVAGSFYDRLFPDRSLHFVHSSSSLHWLSQVPPVLESNASTVLNKGKIYISKSSPQCVLEAYSVQFQNDFSMFLKSRADEMVAGGCMVLSFMGRRSIDPTTEDSCYHWELLAHALMSMVAQGLIEEEKVDSFNAPYYAPCPEEIKLEVIKEGSFIIDRLEAFEIEWDAGVEEEGMNNAALLAKSRGVRVAKTIRAVVESMFEHQFGKSIMDELFRLYAEMVDNYLSKSKTKYINLVISIIKKG